MTELNDLSEEKQQELLDVKKCCMISEHEFEKRFDALSYEDQKTLTIAVIDDDYVYGNKRLNKEQKELNEKVLTFFRKPKYKKLGRSCLTYIEEEGQRNNNSNIIIRR